MSETTFKLQKITYNINDDINDNTNIILEPIEGYIVNNTQPVFIYKIKFNNTEAIIPLYMSDGKTNGFRSNMLFPFLCMKTDDVMDSCPESSSHIEMPFGVIYKLTGCNNINLDDMNKEIYDNTIKYYKQNPDKNPVEIDKLQYFKESGKGVFSVLDRITDFSIMILNLANYKFINLPNLMDKDLPIFDIEKYFVPYD